MVILGGEEQVVCQVSEACDTSLQFKCICTLSKLDTSVSDRIKMRPYENTKKHLLVYNVPLSLVGPQTLTGMSISKIEMFPPNAHISSKPLSCDE